MTKSSADLRVPRVLLVPGALLELLVLRVREAPPIQRRKWAEWTAFCWLKLNFSPAH